MSTSKRQDQPEDNLDNFFRFYPLGGHKFATLTAENIEVQRILERNMSTTTSASRCSIDRDMNNNATVDLNDKTKKLQFKTRTVPYAESERRLPTRDAVHPYVEHPGQTSQEIYGMVDASRRAYISMVASMWQNHFQQNSQITQAGGHCQDNRLMSHAHLFHPYLRNTMYYVPNAYLPLATHFGNPGFLPDERNLRVNEEFLNDEKVNITKDPENTSSAENEIIKREALIQDECEPSKYLFTALKLI